jgi:hypothetical protein
MPIYINVEKAKEMIMNELESLHMENKNTIIKFKDLYKGNTDWSKTFFQAGKELDRISENIKMSVKGGFHQIELTT